MSKELAKTYDPKQIEEKLYERWCENKYFHAEVDRSKKPFTTVVFTGWNTKQDGSGVSFTDRMF